MSEGHFCAATMDEIRKTLEVVARSTQATASVAEAVKKAVENKRATADWSKLITKPNLFTISHKNKRSKRSGSGHGYFRRIYAQWMRRT